MMPEVIDYCGFESAYQFFYLTGNAKTQNRSTRTTFEVLQFQNYKTEAFFCFFHPEAVPAKIKTGSRHF